MLEENILTGLPVPEVPNCSVAEYILPRIKATPKDKVVLIDGETGESRTSWQLLTGSLQVLQGLKGLGLKQNDRVGMLCRNSFEANEIMTASWLGALSVAPINGFMKVAELKHIFDLIKPKILFCEEENLGNISAAADYLVTTPVIIVVDKSDNSSYTYMNYQDLKEEIDVDSFVPEPVKSPGSQIIVIPPSSGTSGLPKGIGVTHTNLIFQDKTMEYMGLFKASVIFLQISHFFWVTGILGLFRALSTGGIRIFVKNINQKTVLNAIQKYKADYTIMAPLSLAGITKYPEFHSYDLSTVKYIILAGSTLSENVLKFIKSAWPNLNIYQAYGLTEACGMTCFNVDGDLSVGRVCTGVQLKVLETKTGKVLKSNTPGEICLKSPGIMFGYIGNEEGTRETVDEEGWLHTGDIGYYDDTGKVYIVDRIKEMIKVRNMQVAPAEIENIITGTPGVVEVGVVGIPHETDINQLMALVVKHKNINVTEADIHSQVDSTLSDYKKLTAGVYFVSNIPKTETGKIHRNELRAMAMKFLTENI